MKYSIKRFGFVQDFKRNPKETLRKTAHSGVDYAIDNPADTAAWAIGDIYVPGKLAGMAKKKWKGPKGKVAAGALGVYALSPFGAATLAIAKKNQWKKDKEKKNRMLKK